MQKSKAIIYVAPHFSGKTNYLNYLLKLKTKWTRYHTAIVCVSRGLEKQYWQKEKHRKFYLTALGAHTLGTNVNKFFIDNLDNMSNLQLSYLKRDLSVNVPNNVWATSNIIDYELFNKIFVNYEIEIKIFKKIKLKWYEKIIDIIL